MLNQFRLDTIVLDEIPANFFLSLFILKSLFTG